MEYKKIILKQFIDERGSLLPLEFDSIDFEPKRIFIVNNVPVGTVRGDHAHFTTKQLLICSKCSVNVFLDDGFEKQKIVLVKG